MNNGIIFNHDLVSQGIIAGKVCFKWVNNDCYWNRIIRVKNCRKYFVYQLPQPPERFLRYCTAANGKDVLSCIYHACILHSVYCRMYMIPSTIGVYL